MLTLTTPQIAGLYGLRKAGSSFDFSMLHGELLVRVHGENHRMWKIHPNGRTVQVLDAPRSIVDGVLLEEES